MEENKNQEEAPKLTYEQYEQLVKMLQNKCLELDNRVRQLDNVFTRLNYLFNVLDRATHFDDEFVEACAKEIQNILDTRQKEDTEE